MSSFLGAKARPSASSVLCSRMFVTSFLTDLILPSPIV
jgi:hypothetical protein